MQKLEIIDAELARLHATYNHLVSCIAETDSSDIITQLAPIQDKISAIYDMLEDYDDNYDYERYSLDSMMGDSSDDSASD